MVTKVLDFISILNELQYSYHIVIIVRFQLLIFTAQSRLNGLKFYVAGNIFLTSHALIGYFEAT